MTKSSIFQPEFYLEFWLEFWLQLHFQFQLTGTGFLKCHSGSSKLEPEFRLQLDISAPVVPYL